MNLSTCVIYNPAAGRGKARRYMSTARKDSDQSFELRETTGTGHAVELARNAARDGFERIVAVGGDGTVHEVANGILTSDRDGAVFSTWPIGSSCDYAYALGLIDWWKRDRRDTLEIRSADVGRITASGRERYFVNGCGFGFNGMVTVESRKIKMLRGMPLYALALFRALVNHFRKPEFELQIDGLTSRAPTLALTINLGLREGGFPLTREAKLDDGLFDYLHAADLTRLDLVRYFPSMTIGRLPKNDPKLRTGTCSRVTIQSASALCVHADGEFFSTPEDNLKEFTVELLPKRLKVETSPNFTARAFCVG